MEFANTVLGAKLFVVIGHTNCETISAACKIPEVMGHPESPINAIKPTAEMAKKVLGNLVENVRKLAANTLMNVIVITTYY